MGILLALFASLATYGLAHAARQCVDDNTVCKDYANHCNNAHYASYMRTHCRLTCGYCRPNAGATPQPDPTEGNGKCVDLNTVDCGRIAQHCQEQHYYVYARKYCRLTCRFCVPENSGPNNQETTSAELTEEVSQTTAGATAPAGTTAQEEHPDEATTTEPEVSGEQVEKDTPSAKPNEEATTEATANDETTQAMETTRAESSEETTSFEEQAEKPTTAAPTGADIQCSDGKMTPDQRALILNDHNAFRSNIAKGLEEINDYEGMAPSAKNMYKLSWDCELEKSSQAWANTCPDIRVRPHSGAKGKGENMYWKWSNVEPAPEYILKDASKSWWSELQQYGMGGSWTMSQAISNRGLAHFTQMAWGATTRMGCAYSTHCSQRSYKYTGIVCCQYVIGGNILGKPIYEKGTPCQNAKDCTTYDGSTCDASSGLCIHP